ncbi:MAG: serine/threonine-protein kinase [Solirubrobacterales bacterium]
MGIRTQSLRAATTRMFGGAPPGVRLRDRFELLVPLGSGGFGTVWEGFDMLLERPVAIKEIIVDEGVSDTGDALREARATARLNHPAVVSLYEIISEPGRIYMISELVHGQPLSVMIEEGLMSDNDIGRIGYGLCEALQHAHAQGVVHRDVKPANVIVTEAWLEGSGGWRAQPAKLMDFGIASIVDGGERGAGPHAGSDGYVAPEQAAGEPASVASDVYSLALVLFECFTGAKPGRGRHSRLARVRADLPAELTICVDACLDTDPWLRPSVDELSSQLSAALPVLSDDLRPAGFLARLAARFGSSDGSPAAPRPEHARSVNGRDYASARVWRFGIAFLAALMCLATMAAAQVPLGPLPPLIAGVLVFLLPRAGWALSATAGAVALAIDGQIGSSMFLVLPALVAAAAAMMPLPRVLDGALAGAGAFAWVVAIQAMSGSSLALSLPEDIGTPQDIRLFADVALDAMTLFAQPAYTASLGVWCLTGAAGVLLYDRFARLPAWGALLTVAFVAQVAVAEYFAQPTPWATVLGVPLVAAGLLIAAFVARRASRVFTSPTGSGGQVPSASRHDQIRV